MAYPWVFEDGFEAGTAGGWDVAESDTGSKLDFPHYTTLAAIPGMPMPYRGAYCMRIDLSSGDTNDHTIGDGDIDIADGDTRYFRWAMWVSTGFTATADDTFSIFELQQAGGTVEMTVGMRVTAATNLLEIGIGDGTAPTSFAGFPRGRWVIVELLATVSTADAGVLTLFLDGGQVATLTSLDQAAAVGQGILGTQLTLSTTTGIMLFDEFYMDDGRLYPPVKRWPAVNRLTKTGHLFVGPGSLEQATILSANGTLSLYDTDTATTNDESSQKLQLDTGVNFVSNDSPVRFERGCYAVIGGTNPVVEFRLSRASGVDGGPTAYGSDGAIKTYASKRVAQAFNP